MLSANGLETIVRVRSFLLAGLLLVCAAGITHAAEWRMDLAGSKLEYIERSEDSCRHFREFDTAASTKIGRGRRVDVTVMA
jgi:hypothetical protein